MNIKERFLGKTPKFWKKVQRIGVVALGISGVIMASPIALPAAAITAAGYLATVGGTITALSQLTVEDSTTTTKTKRTRK
jgi:uncharacterized membrane protein HdeD (DUF308 family)